MRKGFPAQHKVLIHCHLVATARYPRKHIIIQYTVQRQDIADLYIQWCGSTKLTSFTFWNFYLIIFFPNLYNSSSFISLRRAKRRGKMLANQHEVCCSFCIFLRMQNHSWLPSFLAFFPNTPWVFHNFWESSAILNKEIKISWLFTISIFIANIHLSRTLDLMQASYSIIVKWLEALRSCSSLWFRAVWLMVYIWVFTVNLWKPLRNIT